MPPRPRANARRWFFNVLWQQPLYAIPFAVFFGLLFGGGEWSSYVRAYKISLVFAYTIGFSVWATEAFLMSRYRPEGGPRRIPLWGEILTFMGVSIVASMLASVIAHFTFMPGMLGGVRGVLLTVMFTFLFAGLVTGIVYVNMFYHQAIERARSDQELSLARRIQRSFLLSQFPSRARIDVHAVNWSSREVSGDFYDVVPVGEEGLLIAVADVSGKGVPAALLSSMLQASVRTLAGAERSVAAIIQKVNALMCQRPDTGQFVTFFLAWVDERSLTLRYTNAGHNFPVLLRKSGRKLLELGGTVVGIAEGLQWVEDEIALEPGDRLVLYTDGVSEAVNAAGEMFGEERLYQLLDRSSPESSAPELVDHVLKGLRGFLGEVEPNDDVTVLALRVLDGAPVQAAPPRPDTRTAAGIPPG
jgi:serine phosphatase RsbU (regulator of sigma subunit)